MPAAIELPTIRDVIGWLQQLREELAAARVDLAEADETFVMAKEAETIRVAEVLVRLGDEGTVSERDARAKIATKELRFARVLAEQQHRAAKERVRDLRDQLDAVRSLNSAVNTEWRTQSIGQPA